MDLKEKDRFFERIDKIISEIPNFENTTIFDTMSPIFENSFDQDEDLDILTFTIEEEENEFNFINSDFCSESINRIKKRKLIIPKISFSKRNSENFNVFNRNQFPIFENLEFSFMISKDLGEKRVNILSKIINQRSGIIQDINKDSFLSRIMDGKKPVFLVTCQKYEKIISFLKEKFGHHFIQEKKEPSKLQVQQISFFSSFDELLDKLIFVDPSFINACFDVNFLLDHSSYIIEKPKKRKIADISPNLEKKKKNQFAIPNKRRKVFACDKGKEEMDKSPNEHIIKELQRFLSIYKDTNDHWRSYAYNKAINIIKKLDYRIETSKQAKAMSKRRGIGDKIAKKIVEIIEKGSTDKIEFLENNPQTIFFQKACLIYGVGSKTAEEWWAGGWRTFKDITKNSDKLTKNQKIGLMYYSDLQIKIPREEVEEIEEYVKKVALSLNPNLEIVVAGSYRRGRSESGDIDILVCDPTISVDLKPDGLLDDIVDRLKQENIVLEELTSTRYRDDHEADTFMGICKVRDIARRIDIKVYPKRCYPFALLYFTGSNYFNRSMRYKARQMGYSLSDKAIKKGVIRKNGKKEFEGKRINFSSEREIFDFLNIEWKTPQERDI